MKRLDHYWYDDNPVALALAPLAGMFCLLVRFRRRLYQWGWLKSVRAPVPVIVVGNITVGGSGKTPLVLWLAEFLRQRGYRPGIVSRGYGGSAREWPRVVLQDSSAEQVGDEPLLLVRRSGCPVVVGPDRPAAVKELLDRYECDVLLSDDGMQHYRLQRSIEVAVIDGKRQLGNGRCLPAGPLREPATRLKEVDFVVANGGAVRSAFPMELVAMGARNLMSGEWRDLSEFTGVEVHAVAGIGAPSRFFDMLRSMGMVVTEHPFADHHAFAPVDLSFTRDLPILMTEKDAVKCRSFARQSHWYIPVSARLPEAFGPCLLERLDERKERNG